MPKTSKEERARQELPGSWFDVKCCVCGRKWVVLTTSEDQAKIEVLVDGWTKTPNGMVCPSCK